MAKATKLAKKTVKAKKVITKKTAKKAPVKKTISAKKVVTKKAVKKALVKKTAAKKPVKTKKAVKKAPAKKVAAKKTVQAKKPVKKKTATKSKTAMPKLFGATGYTDSACIDLSPNVLISSDENTCVYQNGTGNHFTYDKKTGEVYGN